MVYREKALPKPLPTVVCVPSPPAVDPAYTEISPTSATSDWANARAECMVRPKMAIGITLCARTESPQNYSLGASSNCTPMHTRQGRCIIFAGGLPVTASRKRHPLHEFSSQMDGRHEPRGGLLRSLMIGQLLARETVGRPWYCHETLDANVRVAPQAFSIIAFLDALQRCPHVSSPV